LLAVPEQEAQKLLQVMQSPVPIIVFGATQVQTPPAWLARADLQVMQLDEEPPLQVPHEKWQVWQSPLVSM
jgi:hypothetical protein